MIELEQHDRYAILRLNDPARRNALSLPMFDAIDDAMAQIVRDDRAQVVLIMGHGKAFCAGFDLPAVQDDPDLLGTFIRRLAVLTKTLRRVDSVVVAAVHGAAIAGGCAVVSACDFVVTTPDAKFGYPVHQIGISPAVTLPTLQQRIGAAAARVLVMEGELIDGTQAHKIGLATHLAASEATLYDETMAIVHNLSTKPPHALKVTKRWLNELDGSLDDARFDAPAQASAALAGTVETTTMLAAKLSRSRQNADQ